MKHFIQIVKKSTQKLLLLAAALLGYQSSFSQLAAWETQGLAGNEPTLQAAFLSTNISNTGSSGVLSRGVGVSPSANPNRFSATAFSTSSTLNISKYFQFGLAPQAGFEMTLSSISFNFQRSSAGPTKLSLRSSADGYQSSIAEFSVNTTATTAFSAVLNGFTNITSETKFRLYGFAAFPGFRNGGFENLAGYDLIINGTTQPIEIPLPKVKFVTSNSSVLEGNSGSIDKLVSVSMNIAPAQNVEVTVVDLLTGSATSSIDYVYSNSILTFSPNEAYPNTKIIVVAINGDIIKEANETVILGIEISSGLADISTPIIHTLTILNEDPEVNITSIFPTSEANEGTGENAGSVIVNVQMDIAPTSNVSVSLIDDLIGTATTLLDYIPFDTSFIFTTSETYPATRTQLINFIDDVDQETNETIEISLEVNSGSASLGENSSATITIYDNDLAGCADINGDVLFISELHYDNTGNDINEGVELTGPAYLDLSNYKLYFYDGNGGILYDSLSLDGTIDAEFDNFGAVWFFKPGIQNGPDAIALFNVKLDRVVQLLKYGVGLSYSEPVVGVAAGLIADVISIPESGFTTPEQSLQITGTGTCPSELIWSDPSTNSRGDINDGLSYINKIDKYYAESNGNISDTIWSSSAMGGSANYVLPHANVQYVVGNEREVVVDVDSLKIGSLENNGNILFGTKKVFLTRDFIDNTGATLSDYSLEFIGGINGELSSSFYLNNVIINKSNGGEINFDSTALNTDSTVTINGPNITGTLYLVSGKLNTNDVLSINSDSLGTGEIGPVSDGFEVNGKFNIERYLFPGVTNFRFLTMPISNGTFVDWNDDITSTGFPLSEFPDYPTAEDRFVSILKYDEAVAGTIDFGLQGPSDINEASPDGIGYSVYIGNAETPNTIDVLGNIITGSKTYNLSYTDNPGDLPADIGWNLVGNPYVATIDWTTIDKTNLDDAFYIFNSTSNQYDSYINGVSIGLASKFIVSSQSFYVKANAASPSISFAESNKSGKGTTPFIKSSENANLIPIIKLKIEGNGYADETALVLNPASTFGFDGNYDAYKFFSPNDQVPSISSVIQDGQEMDLSINAFSEFEESFSIPIRVKTGVTGTYTINSTSANLPSDNICLSIEDLLTGTTTAIGNGNSYTFQLSDTTSIPRFIMHVNKMAVVHSSDISCNGLQDGSAEARGIGSESCHFIWKNANQEILKETLDASGSDVIENLSVGQYTVDINGLTNACSNNYSKEFYITNPSENTIVYSSFANQCNEGEIGAIDLNFSDPSIAYNVVLKNSEGDILNTFLNVNTSISLLNLANGNYVVESTNSCETIFYSINLTDEQAVVPSFTIPSSVNVGESFTTINQSVNGINYAWNMGDGNNYSIQNPTHAYNQSGIYTIKLTAENAICTSQTEKEIEVKANSTSINDFENNDDVVVVLNDQSITIKYNNLFESEIKVIDLTGKIAYSQKVTAEKNKLISISKVNFAKGVYVIQILKNKYSITTKKLFID